MTSRWAKRHVAFQMQPSQSPESLWVGQVWVALRMWLRQHRWVTAKSVRNVGTRGILWPSRLGTAASGQRLGSLINIEGKETGDWEQLQRQNIRQKAADSRPMPDFLSIWELSPSWNFIPCLRALQSFKSNTPCAIVCFNYSVSPPPTSPSSLSTLHILSLKKKINKSRHTKT